MFLRTEVETTESRKILAKNWTTNLQNQSKLKFSSRLLYM